MAIIAGTPDPDRHPPAREPLFTARTAQELRDLMDSYNLSVRQLAEFLGVSHMWVQRRARGEVPLSPDDTARIRKALKDIPPF